MSKLLDSIYKCFDFFTEKFPKLLVEENGKDATPLGTIINVLIIPILFGILYLVYTYFWILLVIISIILSLVIYRRYR